MLREIIAREFDLAEMDVLCSPQGRAFETAAIALVGLTGHIRTDDRLREIELGDWTGALRNEMPSVMGETTAYTPDAPFAKYDFAPNGEGFERLYLRCLDFLSGLTRPTLCVTHGITSRMLRTVALGLPPAQLGERPGGQGMVHGVVNGAHVTHALRS